MEKLDRLIEILCEEREESVPELKEEQKPDYFRALCNVRPPVPVSTEFLKLQDEYLTERRNERGVTDANELLYDGDGIALFKGDITLLKADAIVNAGNSAMLGCFAPLHECIDNAIHSAAGVQLRLACNDIMRGRSAENGEVIVTKGYNLPCKYVFHTVGPIVRGKITVENERDLAKCYRNCLKKAAEMKLESIAFCCLSTGVFGYPQKEAAHLAVKVVREYKAQTANNIKVVFDTFTEKDYEIYRGLLR